MRVWEDAEKGVDSIEMKDDINRKPWGWVGMQFFCLGFGLATLDPGLSEERGLHVGLGLGVR